MAGNFGRGPDMEHDDFAAQLANAAKLNQMSGRQEAINEILRWGNENKEALQKAGLVESLLRACDRR